MEGTKRRGVLLLWSQKHNVGMVLVETLKLIIVLLTLPSWSLKRSPGESYFFFFFFSISFPSMTALAYQATLALQQQAPHDVGAAKNGWRCVSRVFSAYWCMRPLTWECLSKAFHNLKWDLWESHERPCAYTSKPLYEDQQGQNTQKHNDAETVSVPRANATAHAGALATSSF